MFDDAIHESSFAGFETLLRLSTIIIVYDVRNDSHFTQSKIIRSKNM